MAERGVTEVVDDKLVQDYLKRVADRADKPNPALHAIGAYGVFSTRRRFEREQDPNGKPWKRLSPRTAAKRIGRSRRGENHILRQKGRLYASINYGVTRSDVEWGSNLVYSRPHQLGATIDMPERATKLTLKRTRRKGGGFKSRFARSTAKGDLRQVDAAIGAHQITIPARPFLGVNAADRSEFEKILIDHYVGERRT